MKNNGKIFAIVGVGLAVAVGLFLLLKPKTSLAQPKIPIPPVGAGEEENACPDKPTFVKCGNWEKTKKCYNPLLVNPATGLNPNGTNPCADTFSSDYEYDYGYDEYEQKIRNQNPGADDTIFG